MPNRILGRRKRLWVFGCRPSSDLLKHTTNGIPCGAGRDVWSKDRREVCEPFVNLRFVQRPFDLYYGKHIVDVEYLLVRSCNLPTSSSGENAIQLGAQTFISLDESPCYDEPINRNGLTLHYARSRRFRPSTRCHAT